MLQPARADEQLGFLQGSPRSLPLALWGKGWIPGTRIGTAGLKLSPQAVSIKWGDGFASESFLHLRCFLASCELFCLPLVSRGMV
jgi:hypothetical protein